MVARRQDDESDTFYRFSNSNARMMHLLFQHTANEAEADDDDTSWQERIGYQGRRYPRVGVDTNSTERKTRLSLELHQSAFYDEISQEIFGDLDMFD